MSPHVFRHIAGCSLLRAKVKKNNGNEGLRIVKKSEDNTLTPHATNPFPYFNGGMNVQFYRITNEITFYFMLPFPKFAK